MDPIKNMFSDNKPNKENQPVEISSPPGVTRNGGQAQGDSNAYHAQTTQAAQNQTSTALNGNERVSTQSGERTNVQGREPTNGQASAPNAMYTPREQPDPNGGYQGRAYHQYPGPYSTNGGYQTGGYYQYTDPYSMNGGYQQYPGTHTSYGVY